MAKRGTSLLTWLFRFLSSLKLAVIVLLGLAGALAAATILESLYDTPTAQFWVYRSIWFQGLLAMLSVNIFVVALSRWPWKPKHTPFLLAHLGILILLFGSWLTQKYGLDGSMRISEGETTNSVDLDSPQLVVSDGEAVRTLPIRWLPPEVEFKPFALSDYGMDYALRVDRFISHAEADFSFLPLPPQGANGEKASPAVRLKLSGGPMRISQDFWLWLGDPSWSAFQAGPAWLELKSAGFDLPNAPSAPAQRGPKLSLTVQKDGSLSYRAETSEHTVSTGRLSADRIRGATIQTQWKGGVSLQIAEWIPDARLKITYKPSRIQHGPQAPPSAIHIAAGKGGDGAETWLGLGSRAMLHDQSREVEIGYFNKRVILPFSVRLDRFSIEHYEGSMNPSSYSSRVTVFGGPAGGASSTISMNEPLEQQGITLYQASYEDAMPRPVTSILSVNRDPGRIWKYLGSLLIVLGSILLFAMKYRRRKKTAGPNAVMAAANTAKLDAQPLGEAEGVNP